MTKGKQQKLINEPCRADLILRRSAVTVQICRADLSAKEEREPLEKDYTEHIRDILINYGPKKTSA